jgi:hypothetical protein
MVGRMELFHIRVLSVNLVNWFKAVENVVAQFIGP